MVNGEGEIGRIWKVGNATQFATQTATGQPSIYPHILTQFTNLPNPRYKPNFNPLIYIVQYYIKYSCLRQIFALQVFVSK